MFTITTQSLYQLSLYVKSNIFVRTRVRTPDYCDDSNIPIYSLLTLGDKQGYIGDILEKEI